jgi:SMODS-associating 2TM, beta-strand rich effector domain
MISRPHLTTLLGFAAILWGTLLILNGVHVSLQFAKPFSLVIGILSIALGLFDRWIWRIPWLHPWFVSRPNLQGTWKGAVIPFGIDVESGETNVPIQAYLVIRQTYSSISIRLLTKESSSELLAGNIVESPDKLHTVFGTYRNTPRLQKREESPIHYGGLFLDVREVPASALDGQYWTDRNTRGELHFDRREKTLVHSFEQATGLIPS